MLLNSWKANAVVKVSDVFKEINVVNYKNYIK